MDDESLDAMRSAMARIFALQASVYALIRTHPQPEAFAVELERCNQTVLSNLLTMTWTDKQVDAYHSSMATAKKQIPRRPS